jgi:hypothetical protein
VIAKSGDIVRGAGLVGVGGLRLPAKSKDVDEHGRIIPSQDDARSFYARQVDLRIVEPTASTAQKTMLA